MTVQYTSNRKWKPIAGVAVVGSALAILSFRLDGAAVGGCILIDKTAWVALEVFRPIILLAGWQGVPAYICEDLRFLQHLLSVGSAIWALLCVLAG
jgi:hypothetical protein